MIEAFKRAWNNRHSEEGVSGVIELVVTMVVLGILMPFVALGAISAIQGSSSLVAANTAFSLQSNAMLNVTQQISSAQPAPYCQYAPGSATNAVYLYSTSVTACQFPNQGPPVPTAGVSPQTNAPSIPAPPTDSTAACTPSNALTRTESSSALVVATPTCIGFFSYAGTGATTIPAQTSSALASGSSYTGISVQPLASSIVSGTTLTLSNGSSTQSVVVSTTASSGATSISVNQFTANANYPSGSTVAAPGSTNTAVSAPRLVYVWVGTGNQIWETTYYPRTYNYDSNSATISCSSTAPTYTNPCWSNASVGSQMIGALSSSASSSIFSYATSQNAAVTPYTGTAPACLSTTSGASMTNCTNALASIAQVTISLSFTNNGQTVTSQAITIPIKGNVLTKF